MEIGGGGYESEGRRFESCGARSSNSSICRSFFATRSSFQPALSSVTGVGLRTNHPKPEKRLAESLRGPLLEVCGDARVVFHHGIGLAVAPRSFAGHSDRARARKHLPHPRKVAHSFGFHPEFIQNSLECVVLGRMVNRTLSTLPSRRTHAA
jgi:hypothetical protein